MENVELHKRFTREEMIESLEIMAENIRNLPAEAMYQPITHYDFYSLITLLSSVLRAES